MLPGGEPKSAAPSAGEAKALAALQALGAQVERDGKTPGKPVVGLVLFGGRITDAEMRLVAELPGLRSLHLEGTQVADAGLAPLAGLKKLRKLLLNAARIGDAGLDAWPD